MIWLHLGIFLSQFIERCPCGYHGRAAVMAVGPSVSSGDGHQISQSQVVVPEAECDVDWQVQATRR